ncbi:hypothetical protein DES53_115113 [Roseimicrobium gellanilyticum]|uniref:Uncharacterized protein n=1 Tax=Roseimicrobium gellanilyticum TaxID=748857 RepID=A0A366H5Q9_9BACT|nr:hypothetical protein [Roseimicrobium gellanilyticum]RBP36972.1 hypothetical protein DES53_115113 [Roseimicrobium gellanilyticum]
MSRRTKFILSGLFLLLLGVPVVYLFLTWSPENSFRIRVDTATPMEAGPATAGGEARVMLSLLVENTGSAPMHLLGIWHEDDLDAASDARVRASMNSPLHLAQIKAWTAETIPPHSTQRTVVLVTPEQAASAQAGGVRAGYVYISQTKFRFVEGWMWLFRRWPQHTFWQHSMPGIACSLGSGVIETAGKGTPPAP